MAFNKILNLSRVCEWNSSKYRRNCTAERFYMRKLRCSTFKVLIRFSLRQGLTTNSTFLDSDSDFQVENQLVRELHDVCDPNSTCNTGSSRCNKTGNTSNSLDTCIRSSTEKYIRYEIVLLNTYSIKYFVHIGLGLHQTGQREQQLWEAFAYSG